MKKKKNITILIIVYLLESIAISFQVIKMDYISTINWGENNPYKSIISDKLYKKMGGMLDGGDYSSKKDFMYYFKELQLQEKEKGNIITEEDIYIPFKHSIPITIHCFIYSYTIYSFDATVGVKLNNEEIEYMSDARGLWRGVVCRTIPFKVIDIKHIGDYT